MGGSRLDGELWNKIVTEVSVSVYHLGMMSNYIPHKTMDMITNPCRDRLFSVIKRSPSTTSDRRFSEYCYITLGPILYNMPCWVVYICIVIFVMYEFVFLAFSL